MAKLVYGLNQSLDGYVDHEKIGPPDAVLFRHFIDQVRNSAGMIYGRATYEIMRYWEDSPPEWDDAEREHATVWRAKPKWVVSRSSKSVGPNATLLEGDLEAAVRSLKGRHADEIGVAGPTLAASLGGLGLIDEYRFTCIPLRSAAAPRSSPTGTRRCG